MVGPIAERIYFQWKQATDKEDAPLDTYVVVNATAAPAGSWRLRAAAAAAAAGAGKPTQQRQAAHGLRARWRHFVSDNTTERSAKSQDHRR